MAFVIKMNTAHPQFQNIGTKNVSLVIGSVSKGSAFFPFLKNKLAIDDASVNNKILRVSLKYPLIFNNDDFILILKADFFSNLSIATTLIDYMQKDMLIVTKDDIVQSISDIRTYVTP